MPFKDGSKLQSFHLWRLGKSLREIQKAVTAEPETVKGWVLDWERGRQKEWKPEMKLSN